MAEKSTGHPFDWGGVATQIGVPLVSGLLGGLLTKKPKYTPMQRMQMDIAKQFQTMGNAVPLSNPDELSGLAQQRALLGNEQQQATGQTQGAMPAYARTSQPDMMANLASSQAGERGALDMQAIAESIARNRQALLSAGQMAGSVGAPGTPGSGEGIPALMGQLASTYAQQQALKAANANSGGGGIAGGWGSGGQPASGIHQAYNPVGGMNGVFSGPAQSSMPVFGQSVAPPQTPGMAAGPQSGAAGMLGPVSGASAVAPALTPMGGIQLPGWNMAGSNWNQIQSGAFGAKKRKKPAY